MGEFDLSRTRLHTRMKLALIGLLCLQTALAFSPEHMLLKEKQEGQCMQWETECPENRCCPFAGWVCCPDSYRCARTTKNCPDNPNPIPPTDNPIPPTDNPIPSDNPPFPDPNNP